ncbi:2-oxo acid dehydrogenase subunit E2 [Buchnera aphidicola]|uniref:Dihydrolipoamide acetyltransferase component of pyruvate dehydrogenase complex n=1 Tax=Buchnera aphidicola (Sarucallis kahawaluokalani) TaxID=1241878 RepID=A0A4D6Y7P2_9GAMM|nr:2-oxo acid dehydrogenase subunit E2 [Buchnera aphidicola]QCI25946.1 dihydrolipoamide acetyltransferase [Buchnera aphidicola (Sarucallis kahawaluokalani)]
MDIKIKLPDIGIEQAEVIDVLVHVNDVVKKEQVLIVIEGDKTSMEIPSQYNGRIKEIMVKVTDIVYINSTIMIMELTQDVIGDKNCIPHNTHVLSNDISNNIIHASPLIRRLSRSLNINLKNITGSGRKNRIIKKDLDDYLISNKMHINSQKLSNNQDVHIKNFDFSKFGAVEKVEISKIKKISGSVLYENWSNIPHVTQFDQVDITDLESFRIKYNKKIVLKEKKITLLTCIIKAVAKALVNFPYLNSSISIKHQKIFLKKYINIGIAVDTLHGLLVPVIKNVCKKNLSDISSEIFYKSQDARNGKLKISDLQGGSFTISSLGGIGGTYFTPIINSCEAAILGVSKFSYQPVWDGDNFIPRLILPLSLSYDHRIIDGAEGARFINFLNHLLSDIRLLLV